MNADFIEALNALEKEKGISKDVLLSAVESALIFAYKRNYNSQGNVRAEIDGTTGEIHIYASKTVVEEVMDPTVEISLAAAKKVNALYEVGDVMEEEADTRKFGRIAAQTAKQVVVQRIREAERGNIYEEYAEKENEILTAIVQRVEKGNAYVELGKTDGILTPNEMIPGETYENSQRIKVYVLEVRKDNRGPQVVVSRRLLHRSPGRRRGRLRGSAGCPRGAHLQRDRRGEDRHHRVGPRRGHLHRQGLEPRQGAHGLHQRG